MDIICFVYSAGANRFMADMKVMLGFKLSIYWKVCWKFLSPAIIAVSK